MRTLEPNIVSLGTLQRIFDRPAILRAVREALVAQAAGDIILPEPGHMTFEDPLGDFHVKFGRRRDGPTFVVKMATGFYRNAGLGLPVNNGLVVLFDTSTGRPLSIFLDEGWLTSWRTAAVGALAASAGSRDAPHCLGIVGAGHQAELQAIWISLVMGKPSVAIWARRQDQAVNLVQKLARRGIGAQAVDDLAHLFAICDVVITCTASQSPIIKNNMIRSGTHIVSLGADGPGKSELDPAVFRRAAIAVDDYQQCLTFGDFGAAVRAGSVAADAALLLGDVLAGKAMLRRHAKDITVITLTGSAAADLAITNWAWNTLVAENPAWG